MYISTVEGITEFVFIPKCISKSDIAIVLGNDWEKTMDTLFPYYKKGYFKKVVITGYSHQLWKVPEAIRFDERALEIGYDPEDIILETKATNTKENFCYSKEVIEQLIDFKDIKKVTLVCKTFHTRRVLMTAEKHFSDKIKYNFLPIVDERNITKTNWWKNTTAREVVLGELKRISDYSLIGDLEI